MVCSAEPHRTVSAQDKLPPASTNTLSTLNSSADNTVLMYTTPHPAPEPKFQHGGALCSITYLVYATPRQKTCFFWEKNMNALINR